MARIRMVKEWEINAFLFAKGIIGQIWHVLEKALHFDARLHRKMRKVLTEMTSHCLQLLETLLIQIPIFVDRRWHYRKSRENQLRKWTYSTGNRTTEICFERINKRLTCENTWPCCQFIKGPIVNTSASWGTHEERNRLWYQK